MIDISSYFITLAACVPLVVLISGYINEHVIKSASSTVHQIIPWIIAIAASFFGQWKELGIFADLNLAWTIIYGIGLGLVSNGIFDISIVQSILTFLKAGSKKEL